MNVILNHKKWIFWFSTFTGFYINHPLTRVCLEVTLSITAVPNQFFAASNFTTFRQRMPMSIRSESLLIVHRFGEWSLSMSFIAVEFFPSLTYPCSLASAFSSPPGLSKCNRMVSWRGLGYLRHGCWAPMLMGNWLGKELLSIETRSSRTAPSDSC